MTKFQILFLTFVACAVIIQVKGLDLYRRKFYDAPMRRNNAIDLYDAPMIRKDAMDLYDAPLRTDDKIDLYERLFKPCRDQSSSQFCELWGIGMGYCQSSKSAYFQGSNYKSFVQHHCPRTCGTCK